MDKTSTYLNVDGRAQFLTRMTERKNCIDIEGEILTESQRYAYALCEVIDDLRVEIQKLKRRVK